MQRLPNLMISLQDRYQHISINTWWSFCIVTLTLFIKVILFHYFVFNSIAISSLWNNTSYFCAFYLPKLAASLLFASPILLMKDKRWMLIILCIIDIWIEANLVYCRSNHFFIDAFALSMTNNMDGFWDSVLVYLQWKDITYFALTFSLFPILSLSDHNRQYLGCVIVLMLCPIIQILGQYSTFCSQGLNQLNWPFVVNQISQKGRRFVSPTNKIPVQDHSVLHIIFWDAVDAWHLYDDKYEMTNEDVEYVAQFICSEDSKAGGANHSSQLIIVLVESLEDWVIQPEWMPNLYYFAHNNADLYCHKIKSQIRQGTSSDGQMIVNTGVLPIQNGATCYLHPLNKFPALTELGSDSNLIILPHNVNVWNQPYMNHAYHIEHYIENSPQDSSLFSRLDKEIHNGYNCILMLTLSTHPPYTDQDPNLSLPQNMPEIMASYIRCCSTVDKGMGKWLENVTSDSIYDDFTIVITGDHRMLTTPDELRNYCESNNTPYYAGEGYCPLIIISPSIKQPIVINEPLLQMDIYPTVLHLLGKEKLYWWKGLGINVLDSSAIRNRPITEKDAYAISDKIIRSDYFNSLIPNVAHPR